MDNRVSKNSEFNQGGNVMRYVIMVMAFIAAFGLAKKAEAQPPCIWGVSGKANDTLTVKQGAEVVVGVVTDAEGTPRAPDGWSKDPFAKGACAGNEYNTSTCGATRWRRVMDTPGVVTATFAVENAGCVGPTKTVTITVEAVAAPPPPPPQGETWANWTQGEKDETLTHVRSGRADKIGVDIEASYILMPNHDVVTRNGHGFEGSIGWRPTSGLKLAAAFRYTAMGIPISELLRPAVMGTTEDYYSGVARAAWSPDLAKWFNLELGGELGFAVHSYSTTFARQLANGTTQFVMEDTQPTFVLGPHVKVGFLPWKYLELFAAMNAPASLVPVDRQVGPEFQDGSNEKKVYLVPMVRFGAAATF